MPVNHLLKHMLAKLDTLGLCLKTYHNFNKIVYPLFHRDTITIPWGKLVYNYALVVHCFLYLRSILKVLQ